MSENSLRIRGKFINKLASKIAEIDEDIELLQKVDRKILRKTQRGGADIAVKDLQKEALKKRIQIEIQNKKLEQAISDATALTTKVKELNDALDGIRKNIEAINISDKTFEGVEVPNISAFKEAVLDNLYNRKIWSNIADNANLGIDEAAYNGLIADLYGITVTPELSSKITSGATWDALGDADSDGKKIGMTKSDYELFLSANTSAPASSTQNKYSFW